MQVLYCQRSVSPLGRCTYSCPRLLQGIVATLDGRRAVIGTAKLLASYGAELTAAQAPAVQRWQDQGELWHVQYHHSRDFGKRAKQSMNMDCNPQAA
jgi:hypothetical protein